MSILFEPFQIRDLVVRNRFIRSATTSAFADDEGRVKDAIIRRYEQLSRGEVGLIVKGHLYVLDNTGLSLRAVAENEALAATMGINTERAHCISWFISGALSALVGSIMTMYRGMAISGTEAMIVSVMSGAILGGVNNIYGAIIGGLFVAFAQDWLRKFFYIFVGLAVEKWQGLLPMMFLVSALIFFPNGILGSEGLSIERARLVAERLRKRVFSE